MAATHCPRAHICYSPCAHTNAQQKTQQKTMKWHTTAHEMRPPTRDLQARYTLYRVEPVARQPTNRIMKPSAAIDAPIATNIIWTASIQNSRKWNTWSNMMMVSDAPRYMVMQNMATPIRHMTVAIIVAYGIRVIHDLQQFPVRCTAFRRMRVRAWNASHANNQNKRAKQQ